MVLRICIVILIPWMVHGQKLHECMTEREIQSVFNVKPHEVHNITYEVTPIYHKDETVKHGVRKRRSAPTIHLKAFNQDYTLYLEENNNLLFAKDIPIFMAVEKSKKNADGSPNIDYIKKNYPFPKNLKLYHNRQKRAAVAVYTDDNNLSYVIIVPPSIVHALRLKPPENLTDESYQNGNIGDELTISSLPSRVHNQVSNTYPSEHEVKGTRNGQNDPKNSGSISQMNNSSPTYHVVMKRSVQSNKGFDYNQLLDNFNKLIKPFPWQLSNWRLNAAYPGPNKPTANYEPVTQKTATVYPEILVAVDHETYEIHGRDVGEFIKYMASFWNAVDLRFRELNKPAVRLHISAFIIPETPKAAPYFENHLHGDNLILVDEVLENVGEYFKTNQEKFGVFDVVVAHSHRKMEKFEEGKFIDTATGLAYLKGTCSIKDGTAVAVIRDFGSFDGVRTAAHELGHSMGAPHDGAESDNTPGGGCSWEDGYIMSYTKKNKNAFFWSRCSKIALRKFFTSERGACLRNKPAAGSPFRKILPGKIISRNEQCKMRHGAEYTPAESSEDECINLKCQITIQVVESGQTYNQIRSIHKNQPPPDGTSCSNDQGICLNGECVQDPRPS